MVLGNEAFARGVLEAGTRVVTTYPGTPTTEIVDVLSRLKELEGKVSLEYSVNEAVALEAAMGASWSGARAVVAFKHVGLNVAADPFHALAYSGVRAGLVVLCGADPGAQSSTNEQDDRLYALHAHVPVVEVSSVQGCKDAVPRLMAVSEKFGTPVLVWASTRLCHATGVVQFGEVPADLYAPRAGEFVHEVDRFVNARDVAVRHHEEALARLEALAGDPAWVELASEEVPLGHGFWEGTGEATGLVTCGVAHVHALEALRVMDVHPPVLRLEGVHPLPWTAVEGFVERHGLRRLVVVEELEPFVELQLRSGATNRPGFPRVVGKLDPGGGLPRAGELSVELVGRYLARVLPGASPLAAKFDAGLPRDAVEELEARAPPRAPSFCPGCAHRSLSYALRRASGALEREGIDVVVGGDIGCYTMSIHPPFRLLDWVVAMGAGLGVANGVARVVDPAKQRVAALVGDSTFYHAGLQPLLNAAWHGLDVLLVLLDNGWTAMTGHQPTPRVDLSGLVRALGVSRVEVVRGYDLKALQATVERMLRERGTRVLIVREECALVRGKRWRRENEAMEAAGVQYPRRALDVSDACVKCDECFLRFGCPAIVVVKDEEGTPRYRIDQVRCVGDFCGACAPLCPVHAIKTSLFDVHLDRDAALREARWREAEKAVEGEKGGVGGGTDS